jgi:hypothetical protein
MLRVFINWHLNFYKSTCANYENTLLNKNTKGNEFYAGTAK